ncbi:MAG TPA: large conductance mechanosensitive channel protein MscL [Membranihabitans sp.]|nr:large conductance mechanosensitive channel protein MscL [Membranihabitans sp.]
MGMLKDFKEFAVKGNMVDMAVGIVLGAAFGTVVKSLVDDIIMPVVSGIFEIPDFSNLFFVLKQPNVLPEGVTSAAELTSLEAFRAAGGVPLAYGAFINALLAFILVAFALWIIVRAINKLNQKKEEEVAEEAPAGPTELEVLLEIRDALRKS